MRYESGAAFRRALEDRLRGSSLSSGVPLVRLRKMVAFDRLLARLVAEQHSHWILKGGLALQLRLGPRARTTRDMDLLFQENESDLDIHRFLVHAALLDLRDWFQFQVARPGFAGTSRFPVQSLLDGRPFETFHIDVGSGDPLVEPAEKLATPPLLEFADIPPALVPCYPLSQQIAEKVHAYTRAYTSGESTRIKDWVDLLLMAELSHLDARTLHDALKATFEVRATHQLPTRLPPPPPTWAVQFRRLDAEMDLGQRTLDEAADALDRFLNPILSGSGSGTWNPATWQWE